MRGLDPRIHVLTPRKTWMAGTGPAMTEKTVAAQLFATTSFTAPAQPVCVRSNTMPSGSLYFAS
jgi:hypothetical protein